jgi:hypothetical protein
MWDGATWTIQRPPNTGELLSVAGEDLKHLYAVGEGALFLHFDGKSAWNKRPSPPSFGSTGLDEEGTYGIVDSHAFFTRAYVLDGHMFLSNSEGSVMEGRPSTGGWSLSLECNPSVDWGIYGFWGTSPDRMWVVTSHFIAWRAKRGPWKICHSPLMYAVWGTDEHNVWAVGSAGLIVQLDDEVLVEGGACQFPEGGIRQPGRAIAR